MSNKYEVNAWVVVEGVSEAEASQQAHDIIGHAVRNYDGFLTYGVNGVCPFYDEGEAPFCEDCEE